MITLSKIAKIAHVSVSTVSKAFSMSSEVSEHTRELIFNVARENNCFREYFNAKYPKYVVAIVCPEFDSTYYSSTLSLIQSSLAGYNCDITVASANFSQETERELLEYYSKYTTVDAIINYGKLSEKTVKSEIPIVNMLKSDDGRNFVCHDYTQALREAIDHLSKQGAENIGFISENYTCSKLEMFKNVMSENFKEADEKFISIVPQRFEEGGYAGMEMLFKNGNIPDAVICGYDDMAIGAMRCVMNHGLNIPHDIMIMGMNDISLSAYIEPPLSTISLKNEITCKAATDMLIARLNGEDYPDYVTVECEFKPRKSTERSRK